MFRRTFWFTAGAAAGVWATTKVNRKLKQLTPESLAAQAANKAIEAGHRLKDFALDVRAGMAQREAELGRRARPRRTRGPRTARAAARSPAIGADSRAPRAPRHADTTHSYNRNEDH